MYVCGRTFFLKKMYVVGKLRKSTERPDFDSGKCGKMNVIMSLAFRFFRNELIINRQLSILQTVRKSLNNFLLLHFNTKMKTKTVKPDTKLNMNLRNIKNFENEPIRMEF